MTLKDCIRQTFRRVLGTEPKFGTHGLTADFVNDSGRLLTASLQWGAGNYCANRNWTVTQGTPQNICRDFEIAVWEYRTRNWVHLSGDTVVGWVSWTDLSDVLRAIKSNDPFTEMGKIVKLKEAMSND